MSQRELEKKKVEVDECVPVADAINKLEGTDYEARPSNVEPADAVLVSKSGKFPDRDLQVVSVPRDFTIRADNRNLEKVGRQLKESLEQCGCKSVAVGITPLDRTVRRGAPKEIVEELSKLVAEKAAKTEDGNMAEIGYLEMLQDCAELTMYFANILICPDREQNEIRIDYVGAAAELPEDGEWIQQGKAAKTGKFSPATEKETTLVIATEALVDRQQAAAFMQEHPPAVLPFASIWVNTVQGPICLKPAERKEQ